MLAENARQLQTPYYPNGTIFSDFELTFYNKQSGATALIGAFGLALAGLAALAF